MKKLTAKQQRFIDEYLVDLNATQAAIRAGYSAKTAQQISSKILLKAVIQTAIATALKKRSERTQINADWLLERLGVEADADLADLYDERGALRPIADWPLIWRKGLVAGIETAQEYEEVDGKKVPIGIVHKLKISDRIRRLELIGKHISVGAFSEKHEHTGKDGGPIQVETNDQDMARWLAFTLASGLEPHLNS